MHGVFAFSFGGHGSGRHLADGSLIIRGGLYAGNEVSCNRGEFRVDVRHSELRLPRLRRKHGLRRQSIQVPGQVSTGLARNLGASPLLWFRQTIDKDDQSELISEERIHMKQALLLVLVISAGALLAQDNNAPKDQSQNNTKPATEQKVVTGCVSRLNGDFVLVEQAPAMTYELHSTGKIRLGHYLGQQVEVAGKQSPSLTTSSDSLEGCAPSSVTLTISSIKTIARECTEQLVSN
jgi:hypothetical protein